MSLQTYRGWRAWDLVVFAVLIACWLGCGGGRQGAPTEELDEGTIASNALRKWYSHDPEKFAEFRRRYIAELKSESEALDELRNSVRGRTVTLLTAAKALDLSHASVLSELLA